MARIQGAIIPCATCKKRHASATCTHWSAAVWRYRDEQKSGIPEMIRISPEHCYNCCPERRDSASLTH